MIIHLAFFLHNPFHQTIKTNPSKLEVRSINDSQNANGFFWGGRWYCWWVGNQKSGCQLTSLRLIVYPLIPLENKVTEHHPTGGWPSDSFQPSTVCDRFLVPQNFLGPGSVGWWILSLTPRSDSVGSFSCWDLSLIAKHRCHQSTKPWEDGPEKSEFFNHVFNRMFGW